MKIVLYLVKMGSKRKSEIEADLRNDDKRYSFFTPSYVRSSVWKHFKLIRFLDTVEHFARCNHCDEILSYAPRSGTGSLLRHRCVRAREKSSSAKVLPPTQSTSSLMRSAMLVKKTNENVVKSQLKFILKDLRSLGTTEGDGFRKFAQALINIGAECGKQDIEEILVSRTNMINSLIPAEYFNIRNHLEYSLTNNHAAFTTDTWTDESSKRIFLSLSAHYINDDFDLDSSLLGTRELKSLDEKNSDRIHYFVTDILNEFQVKDKLYRGVIITDNSPVFVKAFRSYKRISCICHNLQLLTKEVLESSDIKEIQQLMEDSRNFMKFCENSDLNNALPRSNENEKFSSAFNTLSNVFTIYNEMEQMLIERNEWKDVSTINFHLLHSIVSFFGPFKECFDILSIQTTPAIAEYCNWYEKMQKCCLDRPKDSEIIVELKTATRINLEKTLTPDILHYVAFFLNPQYKNNSILSADLLKKVKNAIKVLLEDLIMQEYTLTQPDAAAGNYDTTTVSSMSNAQNDPLTDSSEDGINFNYLNRIDNELQKYLEINMEQCNVLEFWRNALDFPILRKISRQILNIPTNCMTCGGAVFGLGDLLEGGKANISSETIDQLLFLHINTGYANLKIENSMET